MNTLEVIHRQQSIALAEPDLLQLCLIGSRSERTQSEYERDLRRFFIWLLKEPPSPEAIAQFMSLSQPMATTVMLRYIDAMRKGTDTSPPKPKAPATINRRLAAIKALVRIGRQLEKCNFSLEDIKGEKVQQYRDTSGVEPQEIGKVLSLCDRSTVAGKRDYALLLLLWENALRRNEIHLCNCSDFDKRKRRLKIVGKGKVQHEWVNLSEKCSNAISDWIKAAKLKSDSPLFIALDRCCYGGRLSGEAIRAIVLKYFENAGTSKKMSPHRVRHSSITAFLEATDGNLHRAKNLSRHASFDTLKIYDDNRRRDSEQLEASELLSGLVDS